PQHYFNKLYFDALSYNVDYNISSSANESIVSDQIKLNDFNMVIWFVGDESISDNTFTNAEQYRLASFLENGGKLFVSGEDIGLDLDTKHSQSEFSDTLFYRHYLKSTLIHDGLDLLYEVNGEEGTQFYDLNVQFGGTYPVERPDDIEPLYGAHSILNYTYEREGTFRKGGIAYNGNFGSSDLVGTMVYLSFPFETIDSEAVRSDLISRILNYFDNGPVSLIQNNNEIVNKFSLSQNYPNPFNPSTIIKYSIPNNMHVKGLSRVELKIFNILGQEIRTLVDSKQGSGNYQVEFDGSDVSSGIYFYRLRVLASENSSSFGSRTATDYEEIKKMILLK
ncbi:MAG: T9SS type A sorting domain-containing protein, partial [Melioribacteraceae bacterium]|nr:T9SS type A sorting domain-containing protein [Melioribacteraceae bacterium]